MMQPRILIAEDDDLQGSLLRTALEGRGYQAEIVTDGLEAVRRLRTGRYDLALLDYQMPEVDGYAAAQLLHDFLPAADCPRLIAVTATARSLSELDGARSAAAFDAIVSKQVGLPALLAVIDDNLNELAAMHSAMQVEWGQAAVREAESRRRQRRHALLGAVPGVAMAGLFGVGLVWATLSLGYVDTAVKAARQTTALNANTTALIGAVQNAEASERTYLLTGGTADRETFESDIRHVDQLLVAPSALTSNGVAGFDVATGPQTIIEPRLQMLANEAQARRAPGAGGAVSAQAGREVGDWLRGWANDLISGSTLAALAGLDALRANIRMVLAILAVGLIYGLYQAAINLRHRWSAPIPSAGRDRPMAPAHTARRMLTATRLLLADNEGVPV